MSLVSSDTAPEHLLGNSLLAMLSPADRMLLAADLTRVECKPLQRLFRAGEDVVAAYFPLEGCTIALSVGLADGRDVHVGLIGREGAVGGIVSGGNKPGFATAVVETGGPALTLSHNDLQRAKSKSASLVEQFASSIGRDHRRPSRHGAARPAAAARQPADRDAARSRGRA